MSIPRITTPTYETVLPSGKKVKYRPFIVKERAILLLALQEANPDGVLTAIEELFNVCTFGDCQLFKMPIVDVEYLFIKIRNKSVGEELQVVHTCECGKQNEISMNMDNITVENAESSETTVDLGNNNWLKMKYPTIKDSSVLSEKPTEDEILAVITNSIESILIGEQSFNASDSTPEELKEFVKSLTQLQLNKIEDFFRDMPKVLINHKYTCKCGKENDIVLEGLHNFFD